jgi:hypothetical protein
VAKAQWYNTRLIVPRSGGSNAAATGTGGGGGNGKEGKTKITTIRFSVDPFHLCQTGIILLVCAIVAKLT